MVMFDTDIIIGLIQGNPDAQQTYERYKNNIIISSFTWYELIVGCCKSKNPRHQLAEVIRCLGSARIMLFDDTVATLAARTTALLSKKGKPTGIVDNFIAASCVANRQPLIPRNTKHFKNIPGLKVERW